MNYDFDYIYSELGALGLTPFVKLVENQRTYKLFTGVSTITPYRSSAGGRAYGNEMFHIYTAERIDICSVEVLGRGPVPPKSLIGGYIVSGNFIDYDRVNVPGFQELWRECSGEQRHDFSQEFTRYLISRGAMPSGVIGCLWTSISGQALGIPGRCYAITASGVPHITFIRSYEYQ